MRGWSPGLLTGLDRGDVLPAYAGVVPGSRPAPAGKRRSPRLRGGGPFDMDDVLRGTRFSPPTRGWSADHAGGLEQQVVLPAYAGVVPTVSSSTSAAACSPRLRGGGPDDPHYADFNAYVLPAYAGVVRRTWCRTARPRRSPRLRGGGPPPVLEPVGWIRFSPPTRGWSLKRPRRTRLHAVLPAYAGVVRSLARQFGCGTCSPRLRGGGPYTQRDDGAAAPFSPPTRGWSQVLDHVVRGIRIFPAYAGVRCRC